MNRWTQYFEDLLEYKINMKTQKITRKDLQTIYGQVCSDWQKKITELALWHSGDIIEVEDSLILKAFGDADAKQREMLKKYFKVTNGNILDEIESFDDIVRIAKEKYRKFYNPIDLKKAMYELNMDEDEVKRLNADRKLELIELVLNEGWKADWNNSNQYKWSPWFKKEVGGWVARDLAGCFFCSADAGVGSYFKDEKTAVFAGKKFLDIYKEKLPA